MRQAVSLIIAFVLLVLTSETSWAYRDYFTPEQKQQLAGIQTVLVRVVTMTDRGPVEAGPIEDVVSLRLAELGYTTVTEASEPHDVVFKVKCEQRKTWEGTVVLGGDADLPDAPARLWKGPACQLTYRLGNLKVQWHKEVRTEYEDSVVAAKAANAGDPGEYAMTTLRGLLNQYDFPMLLAAEWGQGERLLELLDQPGVNELRKLRIISTLGEMQADEALPRLKQALRNKDLAKEAAVAIGSLGRDGIPLLVDILKNSKEPELQAAAAKGLGRVGGLAGDPRVVPPLLAMLDPPGGVDMRVQIEVAWALGKMPDKKSIEPLETLFTKMLSIRDPSNRQLQELKEALNWSFKQVQGCIEGC
ncbi:MAG: HEAT repeat domain-containing protein [Nitrospiraceae bacterium]